MDIDDLKSQLARKFRGASLDDVQGLSDFTLFGEAASNVLSEIDPYETVRLHRFSLFADVPDYGPPSDLKGKKVIDPRPQDGRAGEEYSQTFTKEFDRDREIGKVSVEIMDGVKVLRVNGAGEASQRVDQTQATTEWAASGGATGLELDEVIRLDNSDTLRVDLGAAGGYIEAGVAGTMTQVDIDDMLLIGSFFRKIYIPTAANAAAITSVSLRIGSSSGAYHTIAGAPHLGSYRVGVNLIRFDWADRVATGSPDFTATDYERLTFVTTAAIADLRIAPMNCKLPLPYETPYYSNCLFTNAAGTTWLTTPTVDTDVVLLEEEAKNIFFYECCKLVAEDLSLDDEALKFQRKLYGSQPTRTSAQPTTDGLYAQYRAQKPTEALRPQSRYIDLRRRRNISRRIR